MSHASGVSTTRRHRRSLYCSHVVAVSRDIAVDGSGGKIYWTDNGTNKLQRANLNGSNGEDIVSALSVPDGLDLEIPTGTATLTPTPPGAVGGIVELHSGGAAPSAGQPGGTTPPYAALLAGAAAAGAVVLSAAAWYARRRFSRG